MSFSLAFYLTSHWQIAAGILVALSMAISRYDARRAVTVDEANAIGTLWLRAGLLDEPLESETARTAA